MKKCLLYARTSTAKQELDSQLKDVKEFAVSLGFDEFVTISKRGASAFKVADEYKELINDMQQTVQRDPDIEAVVVWSLNRLFRSERMGIEIKDWFVEHHIQLYVKEPYIKLLDDNGNITSASEIVFSLFNVFNKQQIDELKAKSKRGKAKNKALHKYLGGAVVAYGYRVGDGNLIEPDPETSKIVNAIFDLYGTGEWSYTTLSREINERYNTKFYWQRMAQILKNRNYYNNEIHPPIITVEQFNKAKEQRDKCTTRPAQSKHHHFANRLIKCPVCGRGYTGNIRDYRCTLSGMGHTRTQTISIPLLDGLLWLIASHLEGEWLLNASTKEDYVKKQAVLAAKIKSAEQSLTKGEKRAERGKRLTLEGLIEVEEYKDILKEVELEQKETRQKIEHWQMEISEIDSLIKKDCKDIQRVLQLSDTISAMDEQQMYGIVRRWIKRITYTSDWVFTIETVTRAYTAIYNRYDRRYNRWFTVNGNPIAARALNRSKDGASFGESRCTVQHIPATMAWLSGSEIV